MMEGKDTGRQEGGRNRGGERGEALHSDIEYDHSGEPRYTQLNKVDSLELQSNDQRDEL